MLVLIVENSFPYGFFFKRYCGQAGHLQSVYILVALLQNILQQGQCTIQNVRRMVKQDHTNHKAKMPDALFC